jgi:glycosyltransferase involved in cell wall biosynthesis
MTAALLDAIRNTGWQVVHVDTSDHRTVDNIGRFDLGNIVLALRHAARYTRMLLLVRPDIVYLPLSQGVAGFVRDAVFLVAARLSTAEVVVHAHGSQYQEFFRRVPAAVRGLVRFSMAPVRVIVVLAEAQRAQFEGWAPRRVTIEVIPNGVRDEWPKGAPQRLPHQGGTVLYLGNLLPQKGFLDVLDAVPLVLRTVPDARFVFAGRSAWEEATAALVKAGLGEPGTREAVTLAGVVEPPDRHGLLETADVFVFPPRWEEGQPLVVLEAMSAGLPVVATASGGLAEMVRDGVEAIIVPRQDPGAIAAAVARLLQDPELRARMGAAARDRFESDYTVDRWAAGMRKAFEKIGMHAKPAE